MTLGEGEKLNEPSMEVEIGLFRPDDAPGVALLFQAVYGQGYPVKVYYDPIALTAAVERGEIVQVVARTARGEVVGVENMFNAAPHHGVFEMGAGLVLPAYRNRGLSKAMNKYLIDEVIVPKGIPMTFGEAVCNHPYQQKAREGQGYVTMALEVDLMPAGAYTQEQSASGRVAALMSFKGYQEREHQVHLPARHAAELREIYEGSGLSRRLVVADPRAALRGASEFKVEVFAFAQVARVAVLAAGADLEGRLDELLASLQQEGVEVTQAWLDLGSPSVGAAAEVLRARGFFLGGVLPRWFDYDGLLLQRVTGRPNWEGIQIASERSRRIAEVARRDWLDVPADDQPRG